MNQRSENLASALIFFVAIISFVYFFPRWADPNQNSRLDMVFAIVEDQSFRIDRFVSNTVDFARIDGHYYSDKAPGVAFLGVPVYASLRSLFDLPWMDEFTDRLSNHEAFADTLREGGSGVFEDKLRFAIMQVVIAGLLAALPTAILMVLMFRMLQRHEMAILPRVTLVLAYGLFTPAFAYANAFYGHQLSATLVFGSFYLLTELRDRNLNVRLTLVGLLLGYAVVTEYPTALLVPVLVGFALYCLVQLGRWKRIVWLLAAGSLVAVGWIVYNVAIFGGPFELGYEHSTLWQEQHQTGFMSLTSPQIQAIWGITFSPFRGLLLLSPWLILSIPGATLWWSSGQHRGQFFVVVATVLLMFLFNASSIMWWGGFSIGPRYLLPALPFLATSSIYAIVRLGKSWWGRTITGFLLLSSFILTWGLSLAGQAFPSDTIRSPLTEYAIPNWQSGNIARNLGTLLGFRGAVSLLPLLAIIFLLLMIYVLLSRRLDVVGSTLDDERGTVLEAKLG